MRFLFFVLVALVDMSACSVSVVASPVIVNVHVANTVGDTSSDQQNPYTATATSTPRALRSASVVSVQAAQKQALAELENEKVMAIMQKERVNKQEGLRLAAEEAAEESAAEANKEQEKVQLADKRLVRATGKLKEARAEEHAVSTETEKLKVAIEKLKVKLSDAEAEAKAAAEKAAVKEKANCNQDMNQDTGLNKTAETLQVKLQSQLTKAESEMSTEEALEVKLRSMEKGLRVMSKVSMDDCFNLNLRVLNPSSTKWHLRLGTAGITNDGQKGLPCRKNRNGFVEMKVAHEALVGREGSSRGGGPRSRGTSLMPKGGTSNAFRPCKAVPWEKDFRWYLPCATEVSNCQKVCSLWCHERIAVLAGFVATSKDWDSSICTEDLTKRMCNQRNCAACKENGGRIDCDKLSGYTNCPDGFKKGKFFTHTQDVKNPNSCARAGRGFFTMDGVVGDRGKKGYYYIPSDRLGKLPVITTGVRVEHVKGAPTNYLAVGGKRMLCHTTGHLNWNHTTQGYGGQTSCDVYKYAICLKCKKPVTNKIGDPKVTDKRAVFQCIKNGIKNRGEIGSVTDGYSCEADKQVWSSSAFQKNWGAFVQAL